MQKIIYKADQGLKFGMWNDKTSKFLYHISVKDILDKIKIPENVADYGGGNGILKKFIPYIKTIDIDKDKNPDIIDNIITHKGQYDLVIIRFVMHYLSDNEIIELLKNIKSKEILVIQFVNKNKKIKYENSQNEGDKYFRNKKETLQLMPENHTIIYSQKYTVNKDFYKNRLGLGNYKSHQEELLAIRIIK